MGIINHQDNGAKGLRIAASVCIVLGWIALGVSVIITFVAAHDIIFGVPFLLGVVAWCLMFLIACAIRAIATVSDAAQLYIEKNAHSEDQYDE